MIILPALAFGFQAMTEILEGWRDTGCRPEGIDRNRIPPIIASYLEDGLSAVTVRAGGMPSHEPVGTHLNTVSLLVLAGHQSGLYDREPMSREEMKKWEAYLLTLLHLRSCIQMLTDREKPMPDGKRFQGAISACRQVATLLVRRSDAERSGVQGDCINGPDPEPIE